MAGIGRLLAEALYDAGAEVHAVSKTASRLGSLAEGRDPARMRVYPQDVSRWAELKALLESMPVMHGLVNNAGTNILERAEDVTEETLDTYVFNLDCKQPSFFFFPPSILNTNLKSAINACQTVARRMRDSGVPGSIVNVSSQASLVGLENHLSYTASKAGMDGVTRVMAVEFGPNNVRRSGQRPTVSASSPPPTLTLSFSDQDQQHKSHGDSDPAWEGLLEGRSGGADDPKDPVEEVCRYVLMF